VGLDDRDLVCRYRAGESLDTLAAAAGLTRNGLYARLRRLGQPPRRALAEHGSINAAAKALGVTREALTGDAQFLGLVPDPPDRPDDLAATYEQLGSSMPPPPITGWRPSASRNGCAPCGYAASLLAASPERERCHSRLVEPFEGSVTAQRVAHHHRTLRRQATPPHTLRAVVGQVGQGYNTAVGTTGVPTPTRKNCHRHLTPDQPPGGTASKHQIRTERVPSSVTTRPTGTPPGSA
jgi:hypothetical protein